MNTYFRSGALTLIVGFGLWGAFHWWQGNILFKNDKSLGSFMETMQTNGVPSFEALDLSGTKVILREYQGRIVLLSFWASWCGPCVEEFPSMISLARKLGDSAILIAVSADVSQIDVEEFLKQQKIVLPANVRVIWDQSKSIQTLYDVDRLPETFIVGPDFKLAKKIVGSINWDTSESYKYLSDLSKR